MSLMVILHQTVAESFDSFMPTGPVLRTFMQFSVIFWSLLEEARDVICDEFVAPVVLDKRMIKFD